MPFNELFLLLLGGYLVFTHFNGTRYRASGFPAQRLIFPAAALGLALYLAARLIEKACASMRDDPDYWIAALVGGVMPGVASLMVLVTTRNSWQQWKAWRDEGNRPRSVRALLRNVITHPNGRPALHAAIGVSGGVLILYFIASASSDSMAVVLIHTLPYTIVGFVVVEFAARTLNHYTYWPLPSLTFRFAAVLLLLASAAPLMVTSSFAIEKWWAGFTPIENIGTTVLALVIAYSAIVLGNYSLTHKAAAAFLNRTSRTTHLEQLFFKSTTRNILVQVNLNCGKVYVGWIYSSLAQIESADGYFEILPAASGYRDDKQNLTIEVKYSAIINSLKKRAGNEKQMRELLRPLIKIVRTDEVLYAGEFDDDTFVKFSLPELAAAHEEEGRPRVRRPR